MSNKERVGEIYAAFRRDAVDHSMGAGAARPSRRRGRGRGRGMGA